MNLIYAAFYEAQIVESFLKCLVHNVAGERIEIDFVDLDGPAFESWDRRAPLVYLVRAGLAEAVFFPTEGASVPPTEILYKKAAVLAPGNFNHTDPIHSQVHMQLLATAMEELKTDLAETASAPAGFFCLSAAPFAPESQFRRFPNCFVASTRFAPPAATFCFFVTRSSTT